MKTRSICLLGIVVLIIAGLAMLTWNFVSKVPTGPDEGKHYPLTNASSSPSRSLRVAAFNIDGGAEDAADLHGIAGCIGNFDLIGLEEAHGNDFASPPNQAYGLAHAINRNALYCPVESQFWGRKTFGNAILTDLPAEHWLRIPISSNQSASNRNVILLRTKFADHDLSVLVTHIDRGQDHALEIREVSTLFLSQSAPAILMGDFNDEVGDPDIANLKATPGVQDPIGKGYDRIFVRGLTVSDSGMLEKHVSDHAMAWAELSTR